MLKKFAEKLSAVRSATILCHMRPDGDTIGSALALSLALDSLGIENEVCCESVVPELFVNLGAGKIRNKPRLDSEAIVCVDCADEFRLGELSDYFLKSKKKTFNIDHHVSNTRYADVNYVNNCSANCQNMTRLFQEMHVEITKEMANFLMMGLLTDSGSFTHSDVNGETMRVGGVLLDAGADIDGLTYQMFRRQKKTRFLLNTRVMNKVRFFLDDRLACVIVMQSDLEAVGAKPEMTEGFVDFPLTVDGVEVSAALMEVKREQFKVSLRSKGEVNVNEVASSFGGGGHVLASGCMLFGSVEEVLDKLSFAVSRQL
ncbi:MAG: bifunctional oligoribonuclease/PAP phosphatase NrnA [Clostridia bacterium]|nr:bifunctional oligoribonuclease/PAP phosphatase NrnA [Clostridia bacterium]